MSEFAAALPMYDWPEVRSEVDREWAAIRDRFRAAGINAPEGLARSNADLPPVPGGIRDNSGKMIAPDPATLPPDGFDLFALWRHPDLLFSQTCWGPMEDTGLQDHVHVVGQPDYSAFEGGQGEFYSSAILMRAGEGPSSEAGNTASLPLDQLRGGRLAFNEMHSMSGLLALKQDLEAMGESLAVFSELFETGSHRASALAVAGGRADVAAIDCRTWSLFKRFEKDAGKLNPVGWTAKRMGLPYVCSRRIDGGLVEKMARALRVHA